MGNELTDKQLEAFLKEIQEEDTALVSESYKAITDATVIESLEENEIKIEEPDSVKTEATFDREKLKAQYAKAKAAQDEFFRNRAKRKKEITRMAFDQTLINMADPVSEQELRLLVGILTESYTRMIDKSKDYINKRLTNLLRPLIPRRLVLCKKDFPESMIVHPGFMFIASKEFGGGRKMWVTPDIPYYFKQGTEMDVLRINRKEYLFSVDKAVDLYFSNLKKRSEKEVYYASKFVSMTDKTYNGLLKLNPFWFELLYNELVKMNA